MDKASSQFIRHVGIIQSLSQAYFEKKKIETNAQLESVCIRTQTTRIKELESIFVLVDLILICFLDLLATLHYLPIQKKKLVMMSTG